MEPQNKQDFFDKKEYKHIVFHNGKTGRDIINICFDQNGEEIISESYETILFVNIMRILVIIIVIALFIPKDIKENFKSKIYNILPKKN